MVGSASTLQPEEKKGQFMCHICDDVIIDAGGISVPRNLLNIVVHVQPGCISIMQAFQRQPLIMFANQKNLSFALNVV